MWRIRPCFPVDHCSVSDARLQRSNNIDTVTVQFRGDRQDKIERDELQIVGDPPRLWLAHNYFGATKTKGFFLRPRPAGRDREGPGRPQNSALHFRGKAQFPRLPQVGLVH